MESRFFCNLVNVRCYISGLVLTPSVFAVKQNNGDAEMENILHWWLKCRVSLKTWDSHSSLSSLESYSPWRQLTRVLCTTWHLHLFSPLIGGTLNGPSVSEQLLF